LLAKIDALEKEADAIKDLLKDVATASTDVLVGGSQHLGTPSTGWATQTVAQLFTPPLPPSPSGL
jgi:hypothetical protein